MTRRLHVAGPADVDRYPLCPDCGEQIRSWVDPCAEHEGCSLVEVACGECGHVHEPAVHVVPD